MMLSSLRRPGNCPLPPVDNSQLLQQFVATKRLEGKSEKTLRQYIRANHRFLASASKHCTHISTMDIRYYLSLYASTGITSTTVHNELRYLSAFYAWLAEEDYIAKNPAAKIKGIRKDTQKKHLLTDNEVEQLRAGGRSARDRAVVDLLASTGLRVSELAALNRRYFATSLHRRGCSLTYISRLLGHASTSMTDQYYIQLCDKDLRAAWEAAVA